MRGQLSFVTWFFGHNNIANRSVEQRTQLPWQRFTRPLRDVGVALPRPSTPSSQGVCVCNDVIAALAQLPLQREATTNEDDGHLGFNSEGTL